MAKRQLLSACLVRSGIVSLRRALRFRHAKTVPILGYHRILDDEDHRPDLLHSELLSASREAFAEQVRWIGANYDPITLSDLREQIRDGVPLPRRPVLITFDDGFSDNYYNAFPVLRDAGMSAVFFVTTEWVNGGCDLWFLWLAECIHSLPNLRFESENFGFSFEISDSADSRHTAYTTLVQMLKSHTDERRRDCLKEIEEKYGRWISADRLLDRYAKPLTVEQIQEMAGAGMEFGSHSSSHVSLSAVTGSALRKELGESKKYLERITGQTIDALAYPNGTSMDLNDRVKSVASELGYEIAVTFEPGRADVHGGDPLELRRLAVYRDLAREQFEAQIEFPFVVQAFR